MSPQIACVLLTEHAVGYNVSAIQLDVAANVCWKRAKGKVRYTTGVQCALAKQEKVQASSMKREIAEAVLRTMNTKENCALIPLLVTTLWQLIHVPENEAEAIVHEADDSPFVGVAFQVLMRHTGVATSTATSRSTPASTSAPAFRATMLSIHEARILRKRGKTARLREMTKALLRHVVEGPSIGMMIAGRDGINRVMVHVGGLPISTTESFRN